MADQEQRPQGISRRTVTKAAAWSVPLIAFAVAAPAAAATDVPVFAIAADDSRGPDASGGGGTSWVIIVRNDGTQLIPANTIRLTIPTPPGADYFLSGYSGAWVEDLSNFDGLHRTFVYPNALASRSDGDSADPYSGVLLLLFLKVPLDKPTASLVVAQITAPPAPMLLFPLSIPY